MFPVDQGALNRQLHTALRSIGWTAEPIASGQPLGTKADISLRGDFAKAGVFIEVEFGNTASLYRDLFKFQIANRSNTGEVAVLIVATGGARPVLRLRGRDLRTRGVPASVHAYR